METTPEDLDFATATPVVQHDVITLEEALQDNPAEGPRPLTIAEYRARNNKTKQKDWQRPLRVPILVKV